MRVIVLTILVLVMVRGTFAQNEGQALIDSLMAELPKLKEDQAKVRILASISYEMRNINPDEGIKIGTDALDLAMKLNDSYGTGLCHYSLGYNYSYMSNFPEAMNHFLQSRKIFETLREYNLLGVTYTALASRYVLLDQEKVLDYIIQAEAILPGVDSVLLKGRIIGQIGNMFRNINQLDSSRRYLLTAIKMAEAYNLKPELMINKVRYGFIYRQEGQLDSAYAMLLSTVDYYAETGSSRMLAEIYAELGIIRFDQYLANKKELPDYLSQAKVMVEKALAFAEEIKYSGFIYWSNKILSDIYLAEGNTEKSLEYLQAAFDTYTSIYGAEVMNHTVIQNWKNEQDLKEEQLALLQAKNRQQWILLIVSFISAGSLIIIVFFVISSRRKLKMAYNLVNLQKQELASTLEKLKQTQSQLIQSEKMASLGMLTAGIAHEINNPVNFINSGAISLQKDYEDLQQFIQSMERQFPGTKKLAEEQGIEELLKIIPQTVEDIQTGVHRTSEIVKGLRNFTRMDASDLKEADIHEGIDSTLLLLSHKIKDRIRIMKDYDHHIGLIKCYPGPLNQVFMNLLNNAIDAIDQKMKEDSSAGATPDIKSMGDHFQIGIITNLIEEGGKKKITIMIRDNGTGIPEEIRDKLFDPFFTTKEVGKGTGLGLSICHGIIEKHGGSISFESKTDEGSTFTITLPVE